MLGEICAHLRNYFVRRNDDIISGKFEITNGTIHLASLKDGQYFRVIGSVFNDGIYKYPASDLIDEVFDGEIWVMSIPADFISICEEIKEWCNKYKDIANSPYSSESFGGYAYTKSAGISVQGTQADVSWQSTFKTRLNRWRKL